MFPYDPREELRRQMHQQHTVLDAVVEEKIRSIVRDELEKSRWTDNTQSSTPTNNTQPLNQPQLSESTGWSALQVRQVQEKLQLLKRRVGSFGKESETLCSRLLQDAQLDVYRKRLVIAHLQSISSLSMDVQSLIDILASPSSTQDQHDGEDETNTGTR